MRVTIQPSARTRRRFSSSCSRAVRRTALSLILFAVAAPAAVAQADDATTLSTEADLAEVESALSELSRRVRAVAQALEEEPPAELRDTLASIRGDLERWADRLPNLEVEPAADADIGRRRYRRFERRLERSREAVNAEVDRVNELLADPPVVDGQPTEEAPDAPPADGGA